MRRRGRIAARDLEDAVRMFEAGASAFEIGRIYGVTARAVQYALARRGLRYRRQAREHIRVAREARRGQIHLLRGRGLTREQMARHLGIGIGPLRAWMRTHMPGLHAQLKAEARAAGRRPLAPPKDRPARAPRVRLQRRSPLHGKRVERDYLAGYSMSAIARHYGSYPFAVWRVLRRRGVPPRPRTRRSPRWLEAMRDARRGRNR